MPLKSDQTVGRVLGWATPPSRSTHILLLTRFLQSFYSDSEVL